MTKYLSIKLSIMYAILIIMVVYIHSNYTEAKKWEFASFLQTFTSVGICRIANCLFFSISGYLFVRNISSMKDVFHKIKKRLRTLLVPYLLWNIIFVLWFIVLEVIPGVSNYVNNSGTLQRILHQPILQTLYNLWIIPAAFQLWFLRDLIVMVLFTPILWSWSKKQWASALIIAIVSTYFYGWLIYFWIGIIVATNRIDIENYYKQTWLIVSCVLVYVGYAFYVGIYGLLPSYIEFTINLCGLYLMWTIYDLLAKNKEDLTKVSPWKQICGYSFFIYLFHEPTFNIIKKIGLAIIGVNEISVVTLYYINPWIMVAVAILVAKVLKYFMLPVYKILTGGR